MSNAHSPNRLWKYRNLMGYKQSDVAKKLNLKCTAMVSRWEKGKSMPTADQLLKLCILYCALPTELYYEKVKVFEDELSSNYSSGNDP